MILLTFLIAQATEIVQIDMLILWILVVYHVVLATITAFFVIRYMIWQGKPMSEHDQNIIYFLVKKALFKAVKEYDEGAKEPIDETLAKPEVKPKEKVKKTKPQKEAKVKVDTSKGGFGDLSGSSGKRKKLNKRS